MAAVKTYGLTEGVTPYPYQVEGIEYGLEKKRLLIGDEPGLGKTLQSIGIVGGAGAWPVLVICPSSLKINWQREIERFTGRTALVLSNATKYVWAWQVRFGMYDAVIVNYESLRGFFVMNDLRKGFRLKDVVFTPDIRMFRSVIVDESHRAKDPGAQQTIFCKGLAAGKEYVILLTGTPVINRPEDLISQLSIMDRLKDFGGRSGFLTRYSAKDRGSLVRLSEDIRSACMIRREKCSVLTDLPEKTRMELYVEIDNVQEYTLAEEDLKQYLREYRGLSDPEIRKKMRMKALVKFMTLRSIVTMGKLKQAKDYIATFLGTGQKLIVFCSLKVVVADLKKRFPRAVTVTGDDSSARKQAAVDVFQKDPKVNLIICSIRAAGVGLTLTAASNVAFVELPWTYADCCQCEDRAHRIGQKCNVTCHYLLGKAKAGIDGELAAMAGFPAGENGLMRDTIDRRLYGIIQRKRSVANTIMASEDSIPTDECYFEELVDALLGVNGENMKKD